MRKILLFGIAATLLVSCQKEFSLDEGILPTNPGNSTCFECEYAPICDSTKITFVDSVMGSGSETIVRYDVLEDTAIAGSTYKKIKELNTGVVGYVSCAANVIRQYIISATGTGGTTINNATQTPLKSNEPVGARWTDAITANGMTIEYRYTIIEKNVTRQVLDSTYSNVIYVRDTTVAIVPLLGELPTAVRHSYYAKGIGNIEYTVEDLIMGVDIYRRQIKSYRIR